MKSPKLRLIASPRNSDCSYALCALDFNEWWTDREQDGAIYLHVRQAWSESVHRVFPRALPGCRCKRIKMSNGKLYWLYDAEVKP